jgi:ABC-2 type transport system ATP-binding protein
MKRRVLVAQALVHRPPVIVLDEPTAGVDVELRQSLWAFVQRLNRDGHTILLTTHYLEEAETLCGRVAMLKQGKMIALDKTANLLAGFGKKVAYFRLTGTLPEALLPLMQQSQENEYWLELPEYTTLETVLHTLRLAQVDILDMALKQTDLEQVFVRLMQKNP